MLVGYKLSDELTNYFICMCLVRFPASSSFFFFDLLFRLFVFWTIYIYILLNILSYRRRRSKVVIVWAFSFDILCYKNIYI